MLKEDQAAELLRRCEAIAGRRLVRVRANLRTAGSRAEAVWELLALEAAAQLGPVEYEPAANSPDIHLPFPTGRTVGIEATYLHPRFQEQERMSAEVAAWVQQAAHDQGPRPPQVRCQFHGDPKDNAGPRRTLPLQQQRREFLRDSEVAAFLRLIQQRPHEVHRMRLTNYAITLIAQPGGNRPFDVVSWGGLVQEAPRVVGEHAAYRSLRKKIRQHRLAQPYVVCIGSDTSPVLRDSLLPPAVSIERALAAAIGSSGAVSGVITVSVEQPASQPASIVRRARSRMYPVAGARFPLMDEEWDCLGRMDFNRWKYTWPLAVDDKRAVAAMRCVGGPLKWSISREGRAMKLTIPANVLIEILAGETTLDRAYGFAEGEEAQRALRKDCAIANVSLEVGDVQRGEPSMITFELAAPHEPVYWPPKTV